MTNHAPIDQPIVEILNQYNPLEIKDILLHGSWRKAVHHKEWDDVLASDIGHKWDLHRTPRKQIEDDVLAIELKIRKDQLGVIDGGKN